MPSPTTLNWESIAAAAIMGAAVLAWIAIRRYARFQRMQHPPVPPLVEVENHILLLLKPLAFLEAYAGVPAALTFVASPVAPDLVAVDAIDIRGDLTFITRGVLEQWDVDRATVHQIALRNLEQRSGRLRGLLEPQGDAPAVLEALDGYDAARLLVAPAFLAGPPERYVLAVPDEHVLLVFVRPAAGRVPALTEEVRRRRDAAHLPLSASLYTWTPAGPAPLDAPAGERVL